MLKFTSMTVNNFGPYEGEQTIDFGDGDGVTLIWGDNGHGKTTLLNLFVMPCLDDFSTAMKR